MGLIKKTLEKYNRSMYLYFPNREPRSAFKTCSITVLRDGADEESVYRILAESGITVVADKYNMIISFPNPGGDGWNYSLDKDRENDLEVLLSMQSSLAWEREIEPAQEYKGIPTYEMMINSWHPMNDTKYLIGIGSGASMALSLAATNPASVAGVLALDGTLAENVIEQAVCGPVPVYLVNSDRQTCDYFCKANDATVQIDNKTECQYNPFQCVITENGDIKFTREIASRAWNLIFKNVRKVNSSEYGDCDRRSDLKLPGFEFFLDDDSLDDKNNIPHTWFLHIPGSPGSHKQEKLPLMVFFHGGSDNPAEAAEMSKFHEIGSNEGFVTIYPWASNRAFWNSNMTEDEYDDTEYIAALIRHVINHYPIDKQRIYLSGFSNGAAMAQVVAMLYPELIAAICPINANWPGERSGPSNIRYEDVKPLHLAMEKKKQYDYRMPVWYTYGSREISYPIYRNSTQQNQYDFWKQYNNIKIKPTPELGDIENCICGVVGDVHEEVKPSGRHPHHLYEINRFFSLDDQPLNLYNYVIMHGKGHDIAEMDPYLGWEYVKQFRRSPDGAIICQNNKKD